MPSAPRYRRLKSNELQLQERQRISDPRYHTPLWRAVAASVRERDCNTCQQCLHEGGELAAMEALLRSSEKLPVDHIKPAYVCNDEEFYDESNLQVLCKSHNRRKAEDDAKKWGRAR